MKNPAIAAFELIDSVFFGGQIRLKEQFSDSVALGCAMRLEREPMSQSDSFFRSESSRLGISICSFWRESGLYFFHTGRYDLAIEHLEQALRSKSDRMERETELRILKALTESKAMIAAINQIK